jgi:cation diffusion facilitator family transporter
VVVVCITVAMMGVEIVSGAVFGSMALLGDGMHMASHAAALGINAFAYSFARRHARDPRFTFGTGKVNALGGFTGAVLLLVIALIMAWEGGVRILRPVSIAFDQAILVAVVGLAVNAASAAILSLRGRRHGHADEHHHAATDHDHHDQQDRHDHNLRSAYLHVVADALTSVLAIVALVTGKYLGLTFFDPAMGIVGAILVTRWSIGLIRATVAVLVDAQGPAEARRAVVESLERDGESHVADLHLWTVGPGLFGLVVSVVSSRPQSPEFYRRALPAGVGLAHVTIEVHSSD